MRCCVSTFQHVVPSGAKARFREKEQQVYEELHDLVQRADVHRDALAATYSVTRDIMALAEVCSRCVV